MDAQTWSERQLTGIAGIGFVVMFVVVNALGSADPGYSNPSEAREFFVDSDMQVHLVTWLGALAAVFCFLPFAAGLRSLLVPAEVAEDDLWSHLSSTAAVLVVAIIVIGSAFWEVLSFGAAETLSDATLVALSRFDAVIFLAMLPWAVALFLVSSAVGILRSRMLARWIGWWGAIDALVLIIGTLWIFGEEQESLLGGFSFVGLALYALWVLVVSIAMLRRDAQVMIADG